MSVHAQTLNYRFRFRLVQTEWELEPRVNLRLKDSQLSAFGLELIRTRLQPGLRFRIETGTKFFSQENWTLVPFMYKIGIIYFLGWPAGLHKSTMN
jgi:hypothetical protein